MPNRRLMSNEAFSLCGSSVLIVNVTPVRPPAPGGWPTFRSLYSRRRLDESPVVVTVVTESIAKSCPAPRKLPDGVPPVSCTTWFGWTPLAAKFTAVEVRTHGVPLRKTPSVPAAICCQAGQSRNQSPPARTARSSSVQYTGEVSSGRLDILMLQEVSDVRCGNHPDLRRVDVPEPGTRTTTSLKSFVANLSDEGIRESMKALERFASNREQWVYKAGRWFCAKRREEAGDLPAQHRPNC